VPLRYAVAPLSTLALDGSGEVGPQGRGATLVRYLDLLVLAAALPVFLAADLPMLAYGVIAGVWLIQLGIERIAESKARTALAGGDRRSAMGWVAGTNLGRVWLVTTAVLVVGLLDERDTGLAAAVLALVLFTVHFGCRLIARAMTPPEERLG
jgi:hypothetical protein